MWIWKRAAVGGMMVVVFVAGAVIGGRERPGHAAPPGAAALIADCGTLADDARELTDRAARAENEARRLGFELSLCRLDARMKAGCPKSRVKICTDPPLFDDLAKDKPDAMSGK